MANTFIKRDVSWKEYCLQRLVYESGKVHVPKVLDYDEVNQTLTMEKVPQLCVADMYGDENEDTPEHLYDAIRTILNTLREMGIYYPDISPYNFIEKGNRVWIIDFGHASIRGSIRVPMFMDKFIDDGYNGWNPDFR